MIDPLTSLAFSIQSQPGVYAVLLGSGVSRAARIPTGWGIVEALLEQLSASLGAETDGDPATWYVKEFGEAPGFSALIRQLAPARIERQALLRGFIETDPAKPGERQPTDAHRALARLAKAGHVRVFLTTNFDRLLEQALESEGITPVVVSTRASAEGAAPFHHENVVVFKLHGDYLDPDSMLVTEDELNFYEDATAKRLASTLEDYGLVICGWSSEWDPALRDAIVSTTARRYPLYFSTLQTPLNDQAQALVDGRRGQVVDIDDADTFFVTLQRRVAAIDSVSEAHPLDIAGLVAAVKHAIPRTELRIELDDLVEGVAKRVAAQLDDQELFPQHFGSGSDLDWYTRYLKQVERTVTATRPLAEVLAVCTAWGDRGHSEVIARAMRHLAPGFQPRTGQIDDHLENLRRLPALLCVYAAGLAAVDREKYFHLEALCLTPKVSTNYQELHPLITQLNVHSVIPNRKVADLVARQAESGQLFTRDQVETHMSGNGGLYYTPVAQAMKAWTHNTVSSYVSPGSFDSTFQRLEVLLDLLVINEELSTDGAYYLGPSWGTYVNRSGTTAQRMASELEDSGAAWPPVAQGLLDGFAETASAAFDSLLEGMARVRDGRW